MADIPYPLPTEGHPAACARWPQAGERPSSEKWGCQHRP
jgi:hypothetical protein